MTSPAFDSTPAAPVLDASELYGAPSSSGDYGEEVALKMPGGVMALMTGVACPLPGWGLLEASGPEAVKFLQSQLTNDVEQLAPDAAQWNGYCTAKGRLLATFLLWRQGESSLLLAMPRPLLEPIRKRLSMYVLRAKVKLADRSGAHGVFGVAAASLEPLLQALHLPSAAPMAVATAADVQVIRLESARIDPTGATVERALLVVPSAGLSTFWAALATRFAPTASAAWRWLDVRAAVARIVPKTSELFVPQMVNLELVGGVNFRKGCYPGQEIVARSQYLGKLKRRMFLGHLAVEPAPGADVSPAAGAEPCGQVVMAGPHPAGGADVLFESRVDALDQGGVRIGSEPVDLLELPYEVPASAR